MDNSDIHIDNYNNYFLIIRSDDPVQLRGLGRSIYKKQFGFVDDVIVGQTEICVKLNPSFDDSNISEIEQLEIVKDYTKQTYHLPVYFNDDADWKDVESHTKLDRATIIARLIKTEYSIAMFGFLPGFVYLEGLDQELHVPRKSTPAKFVEANSIAIGGQYLGVYSIDSPGGWHVIGRVPTPILNLATMPPVDCSPGDVIKLDPIEKERYEQLVQEAITFKSYNAE